MGRFARIFFVACLLALPVWMAQAATCGNDSCEEGENKCTCADDCGQCTGTYGGNACYTYNCTSGSAPGSVCVPTLKLGCCGNGICEKTEAYASCPDDCFPRSVAVDMIDFQDKNFLRGEQMVIRAKVLADLYPAKGADVKAKSPNFLGVVNLFDDGDHNDLLADDGVYGNSTVIPPNAAAGTYNVEVEAFVRTVRGETEFTARLVPYLDLAASLDAAVYALGDTIQVKGSLARLGQPLLVPVTLEIVHEGNPVFSTTLNPDDEGNFSFERRTSLIDPVGEWLVSLKASDTSNNQGLVEKRVQVLEELGVGFLKAEFIEPTARAYDRGNEVNFIVRVVDHHNDVVEKAEVMVLLPGNKAVKALELSPGNYGVKYLLPLDFPVGEQVFTARAVKDVNAVQFSGSSTKNLVVNRLPITVEIVSPSKAIYDLGERIEFTVKAYYSFQKPVEKATVLLDFGSRVVSAKLEADGAYHYATVVTKKGEKGLEAKITVTDAYGNMGSGEVALKIRPSYSPLYLVAKNPLQFGGLGLMVLVLVAFAAYWSMNLAGIRLEEKKKKSLLESKKKVQEQYFNERLIGNREYLQLTEKLNAELDQAEARLNVLKQASILEKIRGLTRKRE